MTSERYFEEIIGAIEGGELGQLESLFRRATHDAQDARRAALKDAFRGQGVALVLGAGVSFGSGVPLWSGLVSRLVLTVVSSKLEPGNPIAKEYLPFVRALEACLPADALITASYVRARLSEMMGGGPVDEARFAQALHAALYQTATGPSLLHRALAALVKDARGGKGVREVLTYNFDDLFEEALAAAGCEFEVVARGERPSGRGVPVMHPHGILPKAGASALDARVVFAEGHYHDEFASPHSWSNVVQLNAFSQLRCVFVGLSMTDPNIRRLLGATRSSAPQHFALLKRRSVVDTFYGTNDDGTPVSDPSCATPERLRAQGYGWTYAGHPGNEARSELAQRLRVACLGGDAAVDETLSSLGVEVLWYDDHGQLPALIESIAGA